jgi:excisionase family DNA binding protein
MGPPQTRRGRIRALAVFRTCRMLTAMTQPTRSTLPDITWLTVLEVADYFRVSKMTVYRWISEGKLPAISVGETRNYRIDENEAKKLMRAVVSE